MNPAVVIGWNPCGDLRGREGAANIVPSRPRRARGHSAHIKFKTVECNALSSYSSSTIYHGHVPSTVRRAVHVCTQTLGAFTGKLRTADTSHKSALRLNFSGPFKGARTLFAACLHAGKQSGRCLFQSFVLSPISVHHVDECTDGDVACQEIGFPEAEKEFPRVR